MNEGKKILISGYYGFRNSGDDAILKAIINEFNKVDEKVTLTALSNDPKSTEEIYGIRAVNRFNIAQIYRELKENDLLISGGGSLIQDVTSTKSIFYYLSLLTMAERMKKPVMVYANGIGPVNKKFNKLIAKKVLNKVDIITLRDYNSLKTLEDLHVKNQNVHVTADPVYALKEVSNEKIDKILENEGVNADSKMVGLCVRKWKNDEENILEFAKIIDAITEKYGVKVLLIPMHYPQDYEYSKKILEHVTKECSILDKEYAVEEIMGIIKRLELIIAMRLHSLIYAATQTTPMFAVVYDPKVDGFMNNIGLEYKINIEELKCDKLLKMFDDEWNNRHEIREKLETHKKEYKERSYMNTKLAMSLLK